MQFSIGGLTPSFTGRWQGHYVQNGERFRLDARLTQLGQDLSGTMVDLDCVRRSPLGVVAPVTLVILYQSTISRFGHRQDTNLTEWILFLEIVLIGIVSGIWWSHTRITRFGT